jgi:hemerythrin-like domain-containing protein
MYVKDLDGNLSLWNLTGNIVKGSIENKSSYHLKARSLLKTIYPTMQILEEVSINPHKSETQYLDFYIPLIKKCIEVHGEQHYKFVSHYHTNKLSFLRAQKKDKQKKEWCELNGIKYIELSYQQQDQWQSLITNE